ncbi:Mor transcription activator family protein [Vibrio fluvialis]|uniref:Mor transcription activator family protein n=1 Tax=Vibrio fluvialis TaxID=676 RepID=UPI001BAEDC1B|nr:Mor transcription activator family protein [Vibrio fluvialis]QUF67763.1 transcriptional regulator [Vibrio fluvialis]
MSDREENLDMFGVENISLSELDKYAEDLINDESVSWPEDLRQMYDIIKERLSKANIDDSLAVVLVSDISQHFGGIQLYLGKGDALKRHLRDIKIWHDFDGKNVRDLIEKYDVGYSAVYRILAKMRAREIRKRQPDLF